MRRNKGLNFYKKHRNISRSTLVEIFTWVFGCATAIMLAYFVAFSIGTQVSMIGVSMEKELFNEQRVFVNKITYNFLGPKTGDVIVFLPNGNEKSHYYIKRVVGVPGDTVQVKDGWLYINDTKVEEKYDKMADGGTAEDLIELKEDEYFVLGDNRNASEDSRFGNIGNVNKDHILGHAWFHMGGGGQGIGFVE